VAASPPCRIRQAPRLLRRAAMRVQRRCDRAELGRDQDAVPMEFVRHWPCGRGSVRLIGGRGGGGAGAGADAHAAAPPSTPAPAVHTPPPHPAPRGPPSQPPPPPPAPPPHPPQETS